MKTFFLFARPALLAVLSLSALSAGAAAENWKPISTDINAEFNRISCPEPRVCYAVGGVYLAGGTGFVFKTSDGGATFSRAQIPTLNPLHGISCPAASVCYVAGDFGTFLKTEDGGESWTENPLGSRANRPHITGLFAIDDKTVIAIGRDGAAYRTGDSGSKWTPISIRITADLYAIHFINSSTGFISGNGGTLLKTENAGLSWVLLRGLKDAGLTLTMRGGGNQALLAVGDSIQKSADLGKTWAQISEKTLAPNRSIAISGAGAYYALSGANAIIKSTDSGAAWKTEALFEGAFLRDILCPGPDFCLAVGSRGQIFKLGTAPEPLPPPPPPPPLPVEATATATATAAAIAEPVSAPAPPAVEPGTSAAEPTKETRQYEAIPLARNLKKGSRGDDVKKLQMLLAGVAGIYPGGEATGFFGDATKNAVAKFQEQNGIAKAGEPGFGEAGPKTRAKLVETAENGASSPNVKLFKLPFAKNMKKGARGDEVKKLQKLLASDAELYPEGEVTGYFGPATARAVGRFQEKYGVAKTGELGYREVGPKTRAALNKYK